LLLRFARMLLSVVVQRLAVWSAAAACAHVALTEHPLQLVPCHVAGVERQVKCGRWEVFENRAENKGRKISLRVVVLPARQDGYFGDPVIFFTGGPGEAATSEAALIESEWGEIGAQRDFLLVDVRGTGDSNPLPCSWGDVDRDFRSSLTGFIPVDLVKHCRPLLESRADLRLYTTSLAVDDVDDVRKALGYGKVNIGGASYGTRAALEYLRRHGDVVRSMFLWDVAPTNLRMPVTFARDAQDAFDGLAAACAAEAPCKNAFPDPKADLRQAFARLEQKPAELEIPGASGKAVHFEMTSGGFAQAVRYMLYSPKTAALVPLQVHRAAARDFKPIGATAYGSGRALISGIADGYYLSVTCTEDVPFFTEEEAASTARGTFLGDFRWRAQKAACQNWPSKPAPASFLDSVRSDVPALLIGGTLDPVNPPRNAKDVSATLSHSRTVMVERGAHDFDGMEGRHCIDHVIAEFVDSGDEKNIDTSCVARIHPAPFVLQ
jgi:pimeloyl-ACP methyl ester carboxylesterase